ncbi:MAG: pyridoxal phosphate-dependent aminotransferase [Clostridiaceae bacterium]|nr:pyridoxal phosphate-dependent aminotransferase [Clostridiaceae bacterium]
MKYNFDEIILRRNTNCIKWDRGAEDVLPMWVADMDFKTAQPIIDALKGKLDSGVFGYTLHPDVYYDAIIGWWERRHNFTLKKDWLVFCPGVVPALSYIIRANTCQGDKVLLQSPVYYPFYRVITNNGCQVVDNPLKLVHESYEIDFEDLENKASDPKVKLMLLCSPHNPVGRVWTREELIRIGEICEKHKVLVIADEIHCDLIYKGYKHIPFASINEGFLMNSITCTAPSKTFNLAGLQVSNLIVPNKELRTKLKQILVVNEIGEPNVFSVNALIAAYNYGEEWLTQLMEYLEGNLKYLIDFVGSNMPALKVIKTEGTYLIWVDCRALGKSSKELNTLLIKNAKVWFNDGSTFGLNGEGFVRINIACPRELLVEGLNRIKGVITENNSEN